MEPVRSVLFDLDDTLYLQAEWLAGAWDAVARVAAAEGADEQVLRVNLERIASEGSGKGRIIDRALAAAGCGGIPVAPLVAAFVQHRPDRLDLLPGVESMLTELRREGVSTAVITDGDVRTQRSKVEILGVDQLVDVIVMSDEMGRDFRKPSPRPLVVAMERLKADPGSTAMIGDRPDKDVAAARAAGVRSIRVRTGEYSSAPDDPQPWRTASTVVDAVRAIRAEGLLSP